MGSYPLPLMSKGERKNKIINMEKGGAWSQGEHDWFPSMKRGRLFNEVVIDVKVVDPNLDILSFSNGRRYCMVGKLIPRPFQWYMEVPITPHG